MKKILQLCWVRSVISLCGVSMTVSAETMPANVTLQAPVNYQVFQRSSSGSGAVVVQGTLQLNQGVSSPVELQARVLGEGRGGVLPGTWQRLPSDPRVRHFKGNLLAPAGGWYRLEVRVLLGNKPVVTNTVDHVGMGEVFVIAGQSNSGNHGEGRQHPKSGTVAAFDGRGWRLAEDPQPGASGDGGSFIPAFGDALSKHLGLPIGVVCLGAGGTSVREWLPKGDTFNSPPTTFASTVAVGDGLWASSGDLFHRLATQLKELGPNGFRSVLWHQGESDSQQAAGHNISPEKYALYLQRIIESSRQWAGWSVPWFVAQVSYHTPTATGSPELRAAQSSLVQSGLALAGPNTDELTGDYRDSNGQGVHFSSKGLQKHGELWAQIVGPWIETQMKTRAKSTKTITLESDVPAFTLPEALVCEDGTRVTNSDIWQNKRRPELLRIFEREIYGKTLLGRPETLRFVVREEKPAARGGKATRLRVGVLFEGTEQGRQMELLIYLPNGVTGRIPLFLGLNFDGNYTITEEPDIPLPQHFVKGLSPNRVTNNLATESSRGSLRGLWQVDQILERGYGLVTAGYGEIEPDAAGNWQKGPRGLGTQPGPGDWGTVGAWAWGLSRALDYLETNPRVDSKRVALIGFSRLGKAALWCGAQDERFAMIVSNESGAGGAALSRRIFGETVENLATGLGHWFAPNFAQYIQREAFLPVDQHELIALLAPRPVLITSAAEDLWSDPKGEFLGGLHASSVYHLLGVEGMTTQEWPKANELVSSRIGYFMRSGAHSVTAADWQAMLTFADKHLKAPTGAQP